MFWNYKEFPTQKNWYSLAIRIYWPILYEKYSSPPVFFYFCFSSPWRDMKLESMNWVDWHHPHSLDIFSKDGFSSVNYRLRTSHVNKTVIIFVTSFGHTLSKGWFQKGGVSTLISLYHTCMQNKLYAGKCNFSLQNILHWGIYG